MAVKIISDSTCDLSEKLIKEHNIFISPLYVEREGQYLKDGIEIVPSDIFEYVDRTGKLLHTAAVSVADYDDYYTRELENAEGIVQFTISSEMSSCYQNACIAASHYKNVFVVDSRSLSTGIGLLVLEAAEMSAAGKTAREIFEHCEAAKQRLDVSFVIDTLTYLSKGGRCSSLSALSAGLLNIKPCIEVKDGKLGVGKKYRGKLSSVVTAYVREKLEGRTDLDLKRIFVTHSPVSAEVSKAVQKAILEYQPFENVYETDAGSTVCNHCGPGTIGILFMTK